MFKQPKEVKEIFDNNGGTVDRYSVSVDYGKGRRFENYLICTSPHPTHPMGVWSRAEYGKYDLGTHLGKRIKWEDLPEEVQQAVINDIG